MTENIVGTDAPTEINATDADQDTGLAAPEATDGAGQEPESTEQAAKKTPEQVEIERLRRALTKRDRTQGKLYQEAQHWRQEAERHRPRDDQGQEQAQDVPIDRVLPIAERMAGEMLAQREVQSKIQDVLRKGEALTGFTAACNLVNEEVSFYDDKQRPTPFLEAVMESDTPHKLLHYLGTNPDLAAELADLKPAQMGRRLERIEAQMKAGPTRSGAPVPLQPVTARSSPKPVEARMSDEDMVRVIKSQRR